MLSVVVPVFNEARTVGVVLDALKQLPLAKEIIVVDDGSDDGTSAILERYSGDPEIVVRRHERNRGKGAALQTGFAGAQGIVLAVQDADLEYDPQDLVGLIQPILDGHADVVYGSRLCTARAERVFMPSHLVANRLFAVLTRLLYRTTISDIHTCYKVMRAEVYQSAAIRSDDFTADSELTAKILRSDWRVFESPISYRARTRAEGKKITWRHGVSSIVALVRYRFLD